MSSVVELTSVVTAAILAPTSTFPTDVSVEKEIPVPIPAAGFPVV